MHPKTFIEPISSLETRSEELIRQVQETGQPVIITENGRATAVLVDIETYEQDREALCLLQLLAQGEAECREGGGIPHGAVKARLKAELSELKGV